MGPGERTRGGNKEREKGQGVETLRVSPFGVRALAREKLEPVPPTLDPQQKGSPNRDASRLQHLPPFPTIIFFNLLKVDPPFNQTRYLLCRLNLC